MRPRGLVPIATLVLAAGACRVPGSVDNGPPPANCAAPPPPESDGGPPEMAATLALVVGTENSTQDRVATAWHDGDHVPLVAGGQGGFMIRPSFDVTAPAALPEDGAHKTCLGVTMLAGAPATIMSLRQGVPAARVAGTTTYHVPALLGLLSYDPHVELANIPLSFYVNTQDATSIGYVAMTVVPDSSLVP